MDENDETLRLYIDRLETWAEDEPPSAAEIRELKSQVPLNENDRDKLELLAENHIRRARSALNTGSIDQAIAELARAAQLKPLDPFPRVELAEAYLQRSLERGYGRRDRQKSIKLAQAALELSPGNQSARNFLNEYRRMNSDFRTIKNRRLLIPISLIIVLLVSAIWWQKDWIVNRFGGNTNEIVSAPAASAADTAIPDERPLPTETEALAASGLRTYIRESSVGRRNDSSYVRLSGRLSPEEVELGALNLELRGRDESGNLLFSIPWAVRDEKSPRLLPGDSQALLLFRWLADSESEVESLELATAAADTSSVRNAVNIESAELVWETRRPEAASLAAEIREKRILEAYDRQLVLMDVALKNTGSEELSHLETSVAVNGHRQGVSLSALSVDSPPLEPGERRVWPMALELPLDAPYPGEELTIRIVEASP